MKKKVLRERKAKEVTEEIVQAVAIAIVEEANETDKTVGEVFKEIVEETKPTKKSRKKKSE